MKYMQCTTCKKSVEVNNTGSCLQCQGFHSKPQKDIWQKKPRTLSEIIGGSKELKVLRREGED